MSEMFSGRLREELEPVDLFSAARYAQALGERELAVSWNEEALMRGLSGNYELEAKKAKAARLKEQKRYSEAAQLWLELVLQSEVFLEDVQEELAIYHEHRMGDLKEALSLSEAALERLQNQATLKKWEHRRARVAMKLARRKSVETSSLFHGPSAGQTAPRNPTPVIPAKRSASWNPVRPVASTAWAAIKNRLDSLSRE
jgi:tetratricopeptide (TPR) repeat protein